MADDYYLAMGSVEKRLELVGHPEQPQASVSAGERSELLALAKKLEEPELGQETRLALAAMMVQILLPGKDMLSQSENSEETRQHAPPG